MSHSFIFANNLSFLKKLINLALLSLKRVFVSAKQKQSIPLLPKGKREMRNINFPFKKCLNVYKSKALINI